MSDGRAGPSTRYIRDACRGISASARAGATSMSAWTGSKEGTLITSNDQTGSRVSISSNWTTSRAGISTSACAGATSSTRTWREGVSCISASTHRSNGTTITRAGVSMSTCAGAMTSPGNGREGISCVSSITHMSEGMTR
jgi:hypothetical protein